MAFGVTAWGLSRGMAFGVTAWGLPRSCRGEWKVARNTNHAKTRSIPARGCRHIYVISGRNAGELPLAPTLHVCLRGVVGDFGVVCYPLWG